jgi:hypothetical protein
MMKDKIMKTLNVSFLAGALTLLSACASNTPPVTLQPVGPAPRMEEVNTSTEGYLVVYSAWALYDEFDNKVLVDHHGKYSLTSDDGKVNKQIVNHLDRFDEGPIRVTLPPGSYKINARSAHSGRVIVPVVVQSRHTTYVYLDGQPHPKTLADSASTMVKLPDGQIVGWAAK